MYLKNFYEFYFLSVIWFHTVKYITHYEINQVLQLNNNSIMWFIDLLIYKNFNLFQSLRFDFAAYNVLYDFKINIDWNIIDDSE